MFIKNGFEFASSFLFLSWESIPDFFGDRVKLTNWTRFSATRFVNSKNVYLADYGGMGVVIKKFAHDHELSTLDDVICKKSKIERPKCRPGNFN